MEVFTKELSKTDVEERLAVPMKALQTFQLAPGQYSKPIEAIDKDGQYWRFELGIRRVSDRDPNPRPELRMGWKNFVQAKGLKVGDKIVFQVEQIPAGEIYKVQKKIRLLGEDIWGYV